MSESLAAPQTFRATLLAARKTATGIEVPEQVVAALGHGRRPPVRVQISGHEYRSTVAVMGGTAMLGVSAEQRAAAGVAAGDEIEVTLILDTSPREVDVPDDLAAALAEAPATRTFFDGLSNSLQRYHVDQVRGAKSPETRERRVAKAVAAFREGRPR